MDSVASGKGATKSDSPLLSSKTKRNRAGTARIIAVPHMWAYMWEVAATTVRRDYKGVGTLARDGGERLALPPLVCTKYGADAVSDTRADDPGNRDTPKMTHGPPRTHYRSRVVSTNGQREFGEQRSRERPTSFNRGVPVPPTTCGNGKGQRDDVSSHGWRDVDRSGFRRD